MKHTVICIVRGCGGVASEKEKRLEEMIVLSRTALTLRVLVEHLCVSYNFFFYALAIVGSVLTIAPLLGVFGVESNISEFVGALVGIAVAMIASGRISVFIRSRGAKETRRRRWKSFVLPLLATYASIFVVSSLIAVFIPGELRKSLAWYPGVGVFLIMIYVIDRRPTMKWPFYTGITILLLSPFVIYFGSQDLALGTMSLVYFAFGASSLYHGLRKALGEEGEIGE